MALPPKGDVTRPVFLAARSMLVLGILCCLLGTCTLIGTGMMGVGALNAPAGRGGGGPPTTGSWLGAIAVFLLIATAFYVGVGVTFIICSRQIKLGKRWAVTTGLVLACVAGAFVGLSAVGQTLGLIVDGTAGAGPGGLLSYALTLLILLALIQLIVHLAQSYRAMHLLGGYTQRGFEVQMQAQPGQYVQPGQYAQPHIPTAQPYVPTAQPYEPPQRPPQ